MSARAEAAPCAHFQKLDVGINNFCSYLDLDVIALLTWLLLHSSI